MNGNNTNTNNEFLNRFSILIDDIKYIKSRQWTVTYYLLLLYAALIGFYKLMGFHKGADFCFEKNLLCILTLLVAGLGTIYQYEFQSRVTRYRRLLNGVLDHLSKPYRDFERDAFKERFKTEDRYISWWNGFWLFTFPFIIILWVGATFIFWFFFKA